MVDAGEAVDMQADQVRVDLLPHPHEGLHEGGADLSAEQPADLEEASDGERIGRMDRLNDEHDESGERERLADRLKNLRRQEVLGRPLAREVGRHQAGDPDQDRPERQHPSRI